MNISEPFIHRPVATTLLTIALGMAGGIAYFALPVAPLFHFHLAAANQKQRVPLGLLEVRQHTDGLCGVGDGPAFGKAQAALVADKCAAQARVAAFGRKDRVARAGRSVRSKREFKRGRIKPKRERRFVHEARANSKLAAFAGIVAKVVPQFDADFGRDSESRPAAPNAPNLQLFGTR